MKIAYKILLLILIPGSILAGPGNYPFIDTYINEQADELNGMEHRDDRKIVLGDVTGDPENEILVFYTIESACPGSGIKFFLAVFKKKQEGYDYLTHHLIGRKSIRHTQFKEIKDKVIVINIADFRKGDPDCCPTIKGSAYYIINDNALVLGTQAQVYTEFKPDQHDLDICELLNVEDCAFFRRRSLQLFNLCDLLHVQNCIHFVQEAHPEYVDLNNDGKNELLIKWGGGSCGANYWVFEKINDGWENIVLWCGSDTGDFIVLTTETSGYRDLSDGLFVLKYNENGYRINK